MREKRLYVERELSHHIMEVLETTLLWMKIYSKLSMKSNRCVRWNKE